ncbi:uncharacterized protein LOC134292148 isoform X2 [Aedes albopictus]
MLIIYQFALGVLKSLDTHPNMLEKVWSIVLAISLVSCYTKEFVYCYHRKSLQKLRDFINEKSMFSGDTYHDARIRSKLRSIINMLTGAVLTIAILEQIMLTLIYKKDNRLFEPPSIINAFGRMAPVARFMNYFLFGIIWFCKFSCCTFTVISLLIGVRSEYQIISHGYECLLKYVLALDSSSPMWDKVIHETRTICDQHVKLLGYIQLIQPVVGVLFLKLNYFSKLFIGMMMFVVMNEPFSFGTLVLVSCLLFFLMEGYWWCWFLDTFQDINEEICSIVYEILHLLHQKSTNQHQKFAQLRKELLIVSTCTPHGARFKWGGIFYIDRAQFVRFIRAGYSVLTFLLNFHSW